MSNDVKYWILPLAFIFCLIVFRQHNKYNNQLSIILIKFLMIIRYVITPISYYYRFSQPDALDISYVDMGIFIMIYEMIITFLTLDIYSGVAFKKSNIKSSTAIQASFSDIGVRVLMALFVITLAMYPQYLKNLLTFSFESLEGVEVESDVNGMFNLIYKSGSIVISCLLLSKFENNNGTFSSLIRCLFISWLCTWLCSLGTSGLVSRTSFLTNGIIFTMLVIKYYPKYKKRIVFSSFGVVLTMLTLGTISRFYNDRDTSSFITDMLNFEMLDSYFGGLRDVVVALKMSDIYDNQLGIQTFFNDIFAGMPFIASRSGIDFDLRSPFFFNSTFFGTTGIMSRIIPIIGQGYAYFGLILSPLPSIICVICALKFNRKMLDSSNSISFYMHCLMMYFFSAFAMYNINIIAGGFWNKIFPIMLVVLLNTLQKKLSNEKRTI